jgi:hypothetical protein
MTLLLHTDIGHDPDDVIALAYLVENGYTPDIITVTPGFPEQCSIVRGVLEDYDISYPDVMAVSSPTKTYEAGKHKIFISGDHKYAPMEKIEMDSCVVIGPPKNIGEMRTTRLVFQGGYSPNSINPLPKFQGIPAVQSFNPSGAREDFKKLVDSENIKLKRFVGKNVCHGFTKNHMIGLWRPSGRLTSRFFDQLSNDKAMHDVLACMIYTGLIDGIWERSKPVFHGLKSSTVPTEEACYSLIGI